MEHAEALERIEIAAAEPDGLERLMAGDTPDAAAVAGHLAGCPSCASELVADPPDGGRRARRHQRRAGPGAARADARLRAGRGSRPVADGASASSSRPRPPRSRRRSPCCRPRPARRRSPRRLAGRLDPPTGAPRPRAARGRRGRRDRRRDRLRGGRRREAVGPRGQRPGGRDPQRRRLHRRPRSTRSPTRSRCSSCRRPPAATRPARSSFSADDRGAGRRSPPGLEPEASNEEYGCWVEVDGQRDAGSAACTGRATSGPGPDRSRASTTCRPVPRFGVSLNTPDAAGEPVLTGSL